MPASEGSGLGALAGDLATASLDMARRFAAGATMWCTAPQWPPHAQHLAVEFVHPVIVGKRALPAVALDGAELVSSLRVVASAGDLLVAVAGADDALVADAMRRAPVWGLRSIWIGTGRRPSAGAADHVLWLEDDVDVDAYGGGFVLLYHLLWELTHVCFEHPGLLSAQRRAADEDADCTDVVCITCSDEGRLAEVVATGPGYNAQVRTAAGIESIDTTLIGTPRPGSLVLVHAGSAVSTIED
ncbi:MAG: hydrogenase assembly protein HupF [Acidimicrobiales bacterium]